MPQNDRSYVTWPWYTGTSRDLRMHMHVTWPICTGMSRYQYAQARHVTSMHMHVMWPVCTGMSRDQCAHVTWPVCTGMSRDQYAQACHVTVCTGMSRDQYAQACHVTSMHRHVTWSVCTGMSRNRLTNLHLYSNVSVVDTVTHTHTEPIHRTAQSKGFMLNQSVFRYLYIYYIIICQVNSMLFVFLRTHRRTATTEGNSCVEKCPPMRSRH